MIILDPEVYRLKSIILDLRSILILGAVGLAEMSTPRPEHRDETPKIRVPATQSHLFQAPSPSNPRVEHLPSLFAHGTRQEGKKVSVPTVLCECALQRGTFLRACAINRLRFNGPRAPLGAAIHIPCFSYCFQNPA